MERVNLLKNSLRKLRAGLLSIDEVRFYFESVLERSVGFANEMSEYRDEIREYVWGDFMKYQEKILKAQKMLGSDKPRDFETCISLLNEAKSTRKKINNFIEVIKLIKSAQAEMKSLEMNLNSLWLQQMPSVKIIYRSIKDADRLLRQGSLLEAKAIIKSCITDIQGYDTLGSSIEKPDIEKERLIYLKKICKDTLSWSYLCSNQPQLEVSEKIVILLNELIDHGKMKLATRLIDDLEFYLKDRILFYDLIMNIEKDQLGYADNLNFAIKNYGWSGGINALLSIEIKKIKNSLTIS